MPSALTWYALHLPSSYAELLYNSFVGEPSRSLRCSTLLHNTVPFNSLSTCTSERTDTRFERLDFGSFSFFLLPHSCSFTHLRACCLENLVKCGKMTNFCEYRARYSTEDAICSKAYNFLQISVLHPVCKAINNLRE